MNKWMTSDLQEFTVSRSRVAHTLLQRCVINAPRRTRTNSSLESQSSQLPLRKEGNPSWRSWCSGGFSRMSRLSHPECKREGHKGRAFVKTQNAGKSIRCPLGQRGLEPARVPSGSVGTESACNAGDQGSIPGLGRPWRRKWQPTPVFLPGESYGQRSLAGCSPWGHKESDTTERLSIHMSTIFH